MKRRRVAASAPTRIDLAGGTLDIWPISQIVPEALTVNLAIELRARVLVEPRDDGRLAIVSRDRRRRTTLRLPLKGAVQGGPLSWIVRLASAFDLGGGASITVSAEAPAGAGLGGSSALGIALGAALTRFTGERIAKDALVRRVQNLETREIAVPTGDQDYLAAVHGGLNAWRYTADGTVREPIALPEGLAERLVLAYTGEPRRSGYSNWDMFRRFVEGERVTVSRMEAIARIARELRDALTSGDLGEAGRLIAEEGRLRSHLAPSVATAVIRRADEAARRAGAVGTKVCGAGGGGCLVAFAKPRRASDVAWALSGAGARVLPLGVAGRGVVVSER